MINYPLYHAKNNVNHIWRLTCKLQLFKNNESWYVLSSQPAQGRWKPQLDISLIKIITDWGNFAYPNFWAFLYSQQQQLKIQKIVDHKLNTQKGKHRRINPKNFKYTMKIKFKYTSTWYTDLVADVDIDSLYRGGS